MQDFLLSFCTGLDVTSGTNFTTGATTYSDVVDVGAVGALGGKQMFLEVFVDTLFTSGGAATLQPILYGDVSDEDMESQVAVYTPTALALTALTAGSYIIQVPIPAAARTYRYFRVGFVVGVANMTAGEISAGIVENIQTA